MAIPTYTFKQITYYDVLEIERWRYNGFEKYLILTSYHDSYNRGENPLVGPEGAKGYAVFNKDKKLFGLMEFYFKDDGVHLGLAINPEFIGRGLSKFFIIRGIEFLQEELKFDGTIRLEVHRKNIQAIRSYESVGFKFKRRNEDELEYLLPRYH